MNISHESGESPSSPFRIKSFIVVAEETMRIRVGMSRRAQTPLNN